MEQTIKNLNEASLRKVFRRLRRSTKGFTSLIARDPLDFLDFEVELGTNLNTIIYEVQSNKYKPSSPYLHLSPKSKGINRPTVVLDIKDALIYRFCIEQIENELLEKTRQKNVRGGIKITGNTNPAAGGDYYEKWFKDWKEHQDNLSASLTGKKYLATTDIASYFENINTLVLKDWVRSDISGKNSVLNLLFYFLENIRFRNDYEVNTFNGLPQEGIDCSRILAYYFLHSHDEIMGKFCKENSAEFYRFVDDMSIAVDEEVTGRKALKTITESLRRLNLVSSIEKTTIMESGRAAQELFFQENDHLTTIEKQLINKLKEDENINGVVSQIRDYYNKLIEDNRESCKNWIKVLKRFYSLSTYAKSDHLLPRIMEHIVKYPLLFSGDRIGKYLIRNQNSDHFEQAIINLIDYLYSDENLYQALESNLIEIFLLLPIESLGEIVKDKLRQLARDILFNKNGYCPLSDYARSLACLLSYQFDKSNIDCIVRHYTKSNENDAVFRKYLVFVALTTEKHVLRQDVSSKAKKEQDLSIQRLMNFIENIKKYKANKSVKRYLKQNEIYIYFDQESKFEIKEKYTNVRSMILSKLIDIYG